MRRVKKFLKGVLFTALCMIMAISIQNAFVSKAEEINTEYFNIYVRDIFHNGEEKLYIYLKEKYENTITSITIPSSIIYDGKEYPILSVPSYMFMSCTALTEVTISEGVKTIEEGAFSGCKNLKTINIPSTVKEIHGSAFEDTPWLKEKQAGNPLVIVNDILIDGSTYTKEYLNIPKGVTTIGQGAFASNKNIQKVVIPDSVMRIQSNAFVSSSLKEIDIPESVTYIGGGQYYTQEHSSGAFAYCKNLEKITLPDSITDMESGIFFGCQNLKEVKLPENIAILPRNTFGECISLEKIELPTSLVEIDYAAFDKCSKLEKGMLPEGLEKIGTGAFGHCTLLNRISIPNTVSKISGGAFSSTNLEEIVIPNSVTEMERSVFYRCIKLKKVTFSSGMKTIPSSTFYGCTSLSEIVIPKNITSISSSAFNGCSNLTNVTIPSSVNRIDEYAFDETPWLERKREENPLVVVNNVLIDAKTCSGAVTVPKGVVSIIPETFKENKKLTKVTIPSGVTTIHKQAFYGCSKLKSITIPKTVHQINRDAFSGTLWLKEQQKKNPMVIVNDVLINGENVLETLQFQGELSQ